MLDSQTIISNQQELSLLLKEVGIDVSLEAISYANSFLTSPYINLNTTLEEAKHDYTALMESEKKRGLDLSLEKFKESDFYHERIDPFLDNESSAEKYDNKYDQIKKNGLNIDTLFDVQKKSYIPDSDPFEEVQRPNHGQGHTMRVVAYVAEICKFLEKNSNEKFSFSKEEVAQIQYMALFSVVGRLNETGWSDELVTYSYFRWRAGEIFKHYMLENNRYKDCGFASEEAMMHCVAQMVDMGNEQNKNAKHVVLNLAHKLDLMRCCSRTATFEHRFNDYIKTFLNEDAPLEMLVKFGEEMVSTTGEYIAKGEVDSNNKTIVQNRGNQTFKKCETDLQVCLKQIGSVTSKNVAPSIYLLIDSIKREKVEYLQGLYGRYEQYKDKFSDKEKVELCNALLNYRIRDVKLSQVYALHFLINKDGSFSDIIQDRISRYAFSNQRFMLTLLSRVSELYPNDQNKSLFLDGYISKLKKHASFNSEIHECIGDALGDFSSFMKYSNTQTKGVASLLISSINDLEVCIKNLDHEGVARNIKKAAIQIISCYSNVKSQDKGFLLATAESISKAIELDKDNKFFDLNKKDKLSYQEYLKLTPKRGIVTRVSSIFANPETVKRGFINKEIKKLDIIPQPLIKPSSIQ